MVLKEGRGALGLVEAERPARLHGGPPEQARELLQHLHWPIAGHSARQLDAYLDALWHSLVCDPYPDTYPRPGT